MGKGNQAKGLSVSLPLEVRNFLSSEKTRLKRSYGSIVQELIELGRDEFERKWGSLASSRSAPRETAREIPNSSPFPQSPTSSFTPADS